MPKSEMTLSEELEWRGFVNQSTFENIKDLDKKKWTFYHGFDASADSQTVGNLAAMMFDKVFMRHGHKAIILAGGATSLIGDPGGKDSERILQTENIIEHNVEKAEYQLHKIFKDHTFRLVNNIEWTRDMNVIEFLRDIGKHYSMTSLIQRDYIAKRLGENGNGITYTEFSYTLLQGMDFLHLFDKYGVDLQLGGSDQWGNCLSGVDLIRRARAKEAHVITLPLVINKATGKKFGKSEDGAVWLDPDKTSPYKFYQFWLNADDEGVGSYLKIFTELERSEVDQTMNEFSLNRSARLAQKTLAFEVTKLVHGRQQAERQRKIVNVLFGSEDALDLDESEMEMLAHELPVALVGRRLQLEDLFNALVETKLASSKSEARRFFDSGAIYINDNRLELNSGFLYDSFSGYAILRRGKNNNALLKFYK
ncbi:MAG TPA: tyrosine--tRNA ligase [Candidatus Saccharimonadales bacterium]|jgi:tyrosyl-tRNA synthetase|nr:tyrosine--tRNA ligase [Candidatus Saccharimonadales bacterium]